MLKDPLIDPWPGTPTTAASRTCGLPIAMPKELLYCVTQWLTTSTILSTQTPELFFICVGMRPSCSLKALLQ